MVGRESALGLVGAWIQKHWVLDGVAERKTIAVLLHHIHVGQQGSGQLLFRVEHWENPWLGCVIDIHLAIARLLRWLRDLFILLTQFKRWMRGLQFFFCRKVGRWLTHLLDMLIRQVEALAISGLLGLFVLQNYLAACLAWSMELLLLFKIYFHFRNVKRISGVISCLFERQILRRKYFL